MHEARARGKSLLLAFAWALSLAALCVQLVAAAPIADAPGWSRTLPDTGVWFLAALGLGLLYRAAGRMPRAFAQPALWLLAVLLASVSTLGESFAHTGTAALVTTQPWLALVYFAGRVPAYYMGFALLLAALRGKPLQRADARTRTEADGLFANPTGEDMPDMPPHSRLRAYRARGGYGLPQPIEAAGGTLFATPPVERRPSMPGAPANAAGGARALPGAKAAGASAAYRQAYPAYAGERPADLVPITVQRSHTFGFTLLLLACWLPYLLAVWPGTVSNDSITQLAEALGQIPLSNGNPVFQTGLVWLFAQVGLGLFGTADATVALYVCVQGVLMAWLLGYALGRIRRLSAPGWLGWLATAFFALCPVFPTFAFCMGKDTNFAMAVLWLMLMAWRVLDSRWPPLRTLVGLALSAVLCALLRNAGVAVAAATLGALFVWALTVRSRQWRAPLAALLATAAAVMALHLLVLPALGALPTPETENWSIPLQQVARTVASETLTDEERAAVDAVMPIAQIQPAYNGELSDPIKNLWRASVTPQQRTAFFATWLRLGLKHPATYASATFHNTYGYLLPGYVSTLKPTLLLGMQGRTTLVDGVFRFSVNPAATGLAAVLQSLYAYAPFRLLVSPGAYGWAVLLAVAGVLHCRKRRYLIAMLPVLVVLLGCLFSAVNGYFRYALPLYFAAPVLMALLSQGLRGGTRSRQSPARPR